MELDFNEIRELLAVLGQSDIAELTIKSDEFELTVRKNSPAMGAVSTMAPPAVGTESNIVPMPTATPQSVTPVPDPPGTPPPSNSNLVDVTSPMVGTFYRAPSPDDEPFVEVGDRISTGQVICILEAMKLMNELEAETSGEIVEILAENGTPVEYGQVLMRVKPN